MLKAEIKALRLMAEESISLEENELLLEQLKRFYIQDQTFVDLVESKTPKQLEGAVEEVVRSIEINVDTHEKALNEVERAW